MPALTRSWRNWLAGNEIRNAPSEQTSTLIGLLGCLEFQAQPLITAQLADSSQPEYTGVGTPGAMQFTTQPESSSRICVPENFTLMVCACPVMAADGVAMEKPWLPSPMPAFRR